MLPIITRSLVLFVLLLPSAALAQEQGQIQTRSYAFKEAGKDMEYTLYVPKSYSPDKKTPLIVALHGWGSSPQ